MSKISRQENKARYKTGMYPTQQDFENVFDSYVHKDDIVPAEQVKSGDKTIIQLINELSERTHTHQIADVEGLQDFINEVNNFLGTVDASNETINRWKELEAFLQGITDTENLLSLLQQYRQEILSAVEGQYLMQVPDLDAYTTAPDGKIVQYIGETNDKYKHGFIYEKVGGDAVVIPAGTAYVDVKNPYSEDEMVEFVGRYYKSESCDKFVLQGNGYALLLCNAATPKPGDLFVTGDGLDSPVEVASVQDTGSSYVVALVGSTDSRRSANIKTFDKNPTFQNKFVDCNGHSFYTTTDGGYAILNNFKFCTMQYYTMGTTDTSTTIGSPASWQPIKVQNVID